MRGQRRHRGAADADQMDALVGVYSTAASSITSVGAAVRRRRGSGRRTAASSPGRSCGRTETRSAPGPGKSANSSAITARAVGSPAGSSQSGQLADDDGRRAREQPGLPQLRHHPIEPIRPLADFVEEQHVARRRIERERRAERRQQLRQRAAEQQAGRLARANRLERRAASARPAARAGRARSGTSRRRSRRRRGRDARRASDRETPRARSRSSGTSAST